MFRLTQTLRNFYLRLEGWLYQAWNLLKKLFSWFNQLLLLVGKVLGFTEAQLFLETEETQSLKQNEPELQATTSVSPDLPATASTTRRRPDAKMEQFLKMAQQTKTK